MIESIIDAPDGHQIQTYTWPIEQAKAWVHINHGMAEHASRYERLTQALNAEGYSVVAHNHRGHGTSLTTQLGHYSDQQGWPKSCI